MSHSPHGAWRPGGIVAGVLSAGVLVGLLGPGVRAPRGAKHGELGKPALVVSMPPPPIVRSAGGPVLAHPRVIAVVFANDAPADVARLEQMVTGLVRSDYWHVTREYGSDDLRAVFVRSTERAPVDLEGEDVERWVELHSTGLGLGPDDIVMLLYPAGTGVRHGDEQSCRDFYGYHASVLLASATRRVPYVVIPRCRTGARGPDTLEIQTATISHELVEAAVNPFPETEPAFAHVDEAHAGWELEAGGGAPTDLCAMVPGSRFRPADLPFFVQRIWSNEAAARGDDPCVPSPAGEAYFVAVPLLCEMRDIHVPGLDARANVVNVPVGERRTIDVALHAFGRSPSPGPYEVSADDAASRRGEHVLQLTLDRVNAMVGESLKLTIESVQPSADLVFPFVVHARRGDDEHVWVGLVTQEESSAHGRQPAASGRSR